jgi:hypothetical protein
MLFVHHMPLGQQHSWLAAVGAPWQRCMLYALSGGVLPGMHCKLLGCGVFGA